MRRDDRHRVRRESDYDEAYIRELKLRKLKRIVRRWLWSAFFVVVLVVGLIVAVSLIRADDAGGQNEAAETTRAAEKKPFAGLLGSKSHKVIPADKLELPNWIEVALITPNKYSRPGTKLDAVNGVVIHYVGNAGTNGWQNHDFYENLATTGETYVSSNFIIGLDGTIILCVPLDEVAYASNDRNHDTISIECCHPTADGAFTEATYESLIKLVDWLRDTYGLSMDEVLRHYEVTGKICPKYYVENPDAWERFLDAVENYEGE